MRRDFSRRIFSWKRNMKNSAKPLLIHDFGNDPLSQLPKSQSQRSYLVEYLSSLGAEKVVEEQNYFDRDYLAEFASFYSTSSAGYPNVCRRLHFFSSTNITRDELEKAIGEEKESLSQFQESYLGFVVLRPLPETAIGRTVLEWFKDTFPDTPRIIDPSRYYVCHLAGIPLFVRGLAWQQQDSAVGACATIGIWTLLHSSAFDDHHAIPTTADITRSAHKTASLGARVFPSSGLTDFQVCEAIKEQNLSPCVIDGNLPQKDGTRFFDKERFASSCAAFIRSGYPVLIAGLFKNPLSGHANVAVGFRSAYPQKMKAGEYGIQDSNVNYLYIHDDNIGPSVRFKICEERDGTVYLKTDSPDSVRDPSDNSSITDSYPKFYPQKLIVAVHNELRTSPDPLHRAGLTMASQLSAILEEVAKVYKVQLSGISTSTRFFKLKDYLTKELTRVFSSDPGTLSRVRLGLAETVNPMSLHIGIIRLGLDDSTPLFDLVFDTTDSDANHPVYCNICFNSAVPTLVTEAAKRLGCDVGVTINGF